MANVSENFQVFLPIAKVNEKKRTISGYASTEAVDSDGEITTLEAIKSALPGYMQWGNIREMHALKAIGATEEANIDEKGLYITARIDDDTAWRKCIGPNPTYKGISIGGRKLAKQGNKITKISLTEISIVDRPSNPDCRIDLVKAAKFIKSEAVLLKTRTKLTPELKAIGALAKLAKANAMPNPPAARDGFSLPAIAKLDVKPELNPQTFEDKKPDGVPSVNDSKPEENITRKAKKAAKKAAKLKKKLDLKDQNQKTAKAVKSIGLFKSKFFDLSNLNEFLTLPQDNDFCDFLELPKKAKRD